jgi:hypothetical protein
MSPRGYEAFHEATGIWVLATVAAGRVVLVLGRRAFFTSLYIALVALTTLHAKTTTAHLGKDVLRAAGLSYLLLPDDMTPQAFVARMMLRLDHGYKDMTLEKQEAERQRLMFSAQRGWFFNEFGQKLAAMKREHGVMADFHGLLRALDDHPPTYEYITLTRRDDIYKPYLPLLASMTPADIKPYAGRDAAFWRDGFFARFAFITPPADEPAMTGRFPDGATRIPTELTRPLLEWHKRLGIPRVDVIEIPDDEGKPTGRYTVTRNDTPPTNCTIEPDALDAYYNYHDGLLTIASEQAQAGNSDLLGNYGRFSEKAMRISMLFASLNNGNRIELSHWARAQTITEQWRGCLHNLAEQVNASSPTEEKQRQEQILDVLQRHAPQTANRISKYIRGLSAAEIDGLCKRLVSAGVLLVERKTNKGTNEYKPV